MKAKKHFYTKLASLSVKNQKLLGENGFLLKAYIQNVLSKYEPNIIDRSIPKKPINITGSISKPNKREKVDFLIENEYEVLHEMNAESENISVLLDGNDKPKPKPLHE